MSRGRCSVYRVIIIHLFPYFARGFFKKYALSAIFIHIHHVCTQSGANFCISFGTGARTVSVRASALMAESILIGDVPQSYIQVPEVEDGLNFVA